MTGRLGRRLRVVVVLGLLVGAAAGCNYDWTQFGNTSSNARASGDTSLAPANLSSMVPQFTGPAGGAITSSPAESNGVIFVTSSAGTLAAFDANGSGSCAGVPIVCQPLWTASIPPAGTGLGTLASSPAVSGNTVFVGTADGHLDAFSSTGATNCAGTPKTCTPLWSASVGAAVVGSPTIDGNDVFVGTTAGQLFAFATSGTTGCTGTPVVCAPLWSGTTGGAIAGSPAVANGRAYVGSADGNVSAFDEAGSTGCSGTPVVCTSLWTGATGSSITTSSPAIAGGVLYVGSTNGSLSAFDTTGATNCTGTPAVCAPEWTMPTGGPIASSPAVDNGDVYVGSSDHDLYAVDAAGSTGCSGTPKVCTPLWTALTGGAVTSSPAVSSSLVFVGSEDGHVYAFDATGSAGCSGSPKACSPLWSATTGGAVDSSPALALGGMEIGSDDGSLHVYKPWTFTRPNCPTNPNGGLSPCQVRDAYRLPSAVAGSGRTVAIVDAYDDPHAEADLAVYRSTYGLPPCTTANGCLTKLNQQGVQGSYPVADKGWSIEITLDLDATSATCPLCKITLVEASSNSFSDLAAAEDTAAATHPTAISNSFGGSEFNGEQSSDADFVHPGIMTTVSTGDSGYGTSYPAAIPGVTAVGGTQLTTDSSTRGWTETAWSGSQSGCSTYEPKPPWQTDTGCSRRTIADVSALAGYPGLAIYTTYGTSTGWLEYGGTSLATPLIASVYALAYPDVPLATTYATTTSLFDITSGNNGSCGGSYLCTAVTGYDGPTGLGTPCGTAAFGTGPFATANCVAGVEGSSGSASAAPHAAPAVTPAISTPACAAAPAGYASCGAVGFVLPKS